MKLGHEWAPRAPRASLSRPAWLSLGIACALATSAAGAYPGDLLSCLNLADLKLPNTTFTSAQYVPERIASYN